MVIYIYDLKLNYYSYYIVIIIYNKIFKNLLKLLCSFSSKFIFYIYIYFIKILKDYKLTTNRNFLLYYIKKFLNIYKKILI